MDDSLAERLDKLDALAARLRPTRQLSGAEREAIAAAINTNTAAIRRMASDDRSVVIAKNDDATWSVVPS